MRILIAEDDPDSCRLLKVRLNAVGHEVVEATNGLDAWALFQGEHFRMVITDWMMPGLAGPDLIRNIRSVSGVGYTYIILLTALNEKANIVSGLESGADEYLTKPFNGKELLARVATGERILKLEETLTDSQRQMEKLAMRDGLTDLLNRRAIEEHAKAELSRSRRQGAPLSVALLDLDHFKTVNDQYGHQVGDQALRQVSGILSQYVRPYDWAGRWGGEEFLLLLPGANLAGAAMVAERIRQNIAESVLTLADGQEVHLRVSIGVGCASGDSKDYPSFEELVKQADEALYQAKREGRNRVCTYNLA